MSRSLISLTSRITALAANQQQQLQVASFASAASATMKKAVKSTSSSADTTSSPKASSAPTAKPKAKAVVAAAAKPSLFLPALSSQHAAHAYANVHRSLRGNAVDPRRIYWYNVYAEIIAKSRVIIVLQNNNMPAQTYKSLKTELREKGNMECLAVKNSLFAAAAANAGNGTTFGVKNGHGKSLEGMRYLFQGPTMIWFSAASEEESPNMIKEVARISSKYKEHLLLVGGSLEGFIFSTDTFEQIKVMPSKLTLLGQLLGLLQYPGSAIASMLSRTPELLASSLDQHIKSLEKGGEEIEDKPVKE